MSSATDHAETVSVSKLKAHLAEYVRKVEEEGLELDLTRRGKVIAHLSPARPPQTLAEWMGSGRGLLKLPPDDVLNEPAVPPEEWEALQERDEK